MLYTRQLVMSIGCVLGVVFATQEATAEQENIRGQVTKADGAVMHVRDSSGKEELIRLNDATTVLSLTPASFIDVDFGTYVGSVSERMGDRYSPIYRDSLSWLHKGLELWIIDESLRGIALGHMKWDLTPASVMTRPLMRPTHR